MATCGYCGRTISHEGVKADGKVFHGRLCLEAYQRDKERYPHRRRIQLMGKKIEFRLRGGGW